METPVTSVGRRSGVNWMRLKEQPLERARLRASIVLPTPGTSSTRRWPPHIRVITASSTCPRLPMMTRSTFSARRCATDLASTSGRLMPDKRPLRGCGCGRGEETAATSFLCSLTIIAPACARPAPGPCGGVHDNIQAMGPLRFPIAAVLLCALTLAATTACSGGDAQAPTPTTTATPITTATSTPRPKPTPTPTPEPTPTPTPVPPSVALTVAYAKQGGFLLVQLLHPPAGTRGAAAAFAGESYPMVTDGDGWAGVIGMATDFPLGNYSVDVTADGASMASVPVSIAKGGYARLALTVPDESINLL